MARVYHTYKNNINIFRHKRNMSMTELAARLNISQRATENYVWGTLKISRGIAAKLSELFGATYEELGITIRDDDREPIPAGMPKPLPVTEVIDQIANMINYDSPLPERDDPSRRACDLKIGDRIRIRVSGGEEFPRHITATVRDLTPYFIRVTHDRLGYSICYGYQDYLTCGTVHKIKEATKDEPI